MRLLSILSLLGACSFTAPAAMTASNDASTDGALAIDADEASGVVPCMTPDASGLVLCLELEDGVDDGMLSDSSSGRRHAITSGLVTATRTVPAMSTAAHVGSQSVTRVAEDLALDLDGGYTFGVWVQPDTLPAEGSVYGILDHEQQYAMLVGYSAGSLENRCVHTGVARYEFTTVLPVGTWSFLACTWNGTQLCAYRWTSPTSNEHFCHTPVVAPSLAGTQGLAIGHLSEDGTAHSRFDGALDSLQIYNRGLTEDQLCTLIGLGAGCMPCSGC